MAGGRRGVNTAKKKNQNNTSKFSCVKALRRNDESKISMADPHRKISCAPHMDNLSLNLMDFWDSFIEHSGFSFDQILSIGLYLLHDSHTSKTDVSWSRKNTGMKMCAAMGISMAYPIQIIQYCVP